MHYAEKNDTLAFLDVIPFENSEYKLATDKLKERLAMLHARKDRHSSRENDKNVGVLAKLLEMPVDIFSPLLNHRPLSQEEFYIERAKAVTAKFYARYPEMKKKMITS
ncbi:hypothetical protein Clacol_003254 [Clathrus columnatus]|uniref:Uncharacterized protein n=1 Tax=Clathrus columnatus TaxID=1419009 RepID=A0AAV5A321_9AGAM|nr:hypothetical protein Clacol_003254 [Clathrus columnatus]